MKNYLICYLFITLSIIVNSCTEGFEEEYLKISIALKEVTAITTPTTDTTPDYTFSSTGSGAITYGGSCSSSTTIATTGNNTITLNTLGVGTYTDCTIKVSKTISTEKSEKKLSGPLQSLLLLFLPPSRLQKIYLPVVQTIRLHWHGTRSAVRLVILCIGTTFLELTAVILLLHPSPMITTPTATRKLIMHWISTVQTIMWLLTVSQVTLTLQPDFHLLFQLGHILIQQTTEQFLLL